MNLDELEQLFKKLLSFLNDFGKNNFSPQIKTIKDILDIINSDMDYNDKLIYINMKYKSLYTPHSGIDEFYIRIDNKEEMKNLNDSLDFVTSKLWDYFSDY